MDTGKIIRGKQYNQTLVKALFCTSLLAIVISLICFSNIAKSDDVKIRSGQAVQLSDEWYVDGSDQQVDFPATVKFSQKGTVTLTTTIPDFVCEGNSIFYNCSYCSQKVYVDDELIWSYATKPALPFGSLRGSCYAIIPMKESYAGKTLTIIMGSTYDATSTSFQGVSYGNTGDFKYSLLWSSVWRLCLGVVLGSVCLFALIIGIYHIVISLGTINSELIYFALLAFSVGGWIFVDPSLVQYFTNNLVVTQYLSFVFLLGVGTFYSGLSANLFYKHKKFFQTSEIVGYFLNLSMIILYVLDVTDPVGYMYIIYAYAFYTLFSTFVVLIRNVRTYNDAKPMLFGTIILIIGIAATIVIFLNDPMGTTAVYPFSFAYTTYVFILFVMLVNKEVALVRETAQIKTYKNLAYTDAMTGISNRAAYDRAIDELLDNESQKQKVTLIIGDLNYLKYTNDNLGHDKGDELIKSAADCLIETFDGIGECYRLGGDEFAVVIVNGSKATVEYIEELQDHIDQFNNTSEIELSLALGTASCSLPDDNPDILNDLFREADKRMYDNKIRMHKARL